MLLYFVATLHVVGFASSVHAVMHTRTAQGAAAWGIFLNTFPYLAVPAYWVFGRDRFHGYVDVRSATDADLRGEAARLARLVGASEVDPAVAETYPLGATARRLAGVPFMAGNHVELLVDGEATFESILAGMARAEDYLLVQFYIVRDDDLGNRFRDALVERARAGVRVHFVYDQVGSHGLTRAWVESLRDEGVEVAAFQTRRDPGSRFQINFRNHRKLVVVDGREAWVGGHNVGDEYLGRDREIGRWRDTHVRIEGPAVAPLQFAFLQDWYWATDRLLGLDWTGGGAGRGTADVLPIASGPADTFETASLMYAGLIDAAQTRVWVATPYFVPDGAVAKSLQLAALRGVEVRVLIPEQREYWATWLAAFAYQARIAPSGVYFRRYVEGFMHQKVMLVDDRVASVGTANLDNRSFRLNFELTAVVAEPGFVAEVASMLEKDFADSEPMPEDALAQRPFWFRLAVNLARLTAPVQ